MNVKYAKTKLLTLVAIMVAIFTISIIAVDIQSIAQPASLKFHRSQGLDTLSTSDNTHRIELRTRLGRGFVLDISPHDSVVLSPNYEEIIHDVSKQTNPNEPHLEILRQTNKDVPTPNELAGLQNCLYHGKISNDPKSVVTINTCSGEISGMIQTGNGELFSIEPVNRLNNGNPTASAQPRQTNPNAPAPLSINNLRELALAGDLRTLSDHTPEILLVDVHAEARLEDLERENIINTKGGSSSKSNLSSVQNRLNVEDIDAPIVAPPASCASDVEKHHHRPPTHILRKAGLNDNDISKIYSRVEDDDAALNILQSDNDSDLAYPTRYVEILIYHDYARLKRFNTSNDMTRDDIIAASRMNAIELFNNIRTYYLHSNFKHKVQVVLSGHLFFVGGDPYTKYLARDGGTMVISNSGLLENFNKYRSAYGHTGHDVGVLLSGNRFQSNIMGVANVGSICGGARYNGNINSITYRNLVKSSVLTAHEIGHTLGANHDNGAGYIMYPYVSSDTSFSPRSTRAVDYYFTKTRCTINNPATALADDDDYNYSTGSFSLLSTDKPIRSRIFTQNVRLSERFDHIDQSLIQDGLFTSADYKLPTDEVVLAKQQMTDPATLHIPGTATSKALSSLELGLIIGLSSLGACILTTTAIAFLFRYLTQYNKDFQSSKAIKHIGTSTSPTTDHDVVTTSTNNNNNNNNQPFTFTPRLKTTTLQPQQQQMTDLSLSPNTPRTIPASPSYSETLRHRSIIPTDDEDNDNTGIVFEHQDNTTNTPQRNRPAQTTNTTTRVEDLRSGVNNTM